MENDEKMVSARCCLVNDGCGNKIPQFAVVPDEIGADKIAERLADFYHERNIAPDAERGLRKLAENIQSVNVDERGL